jgi:hypothetical protein
MKHLHVYMTTQPKPDPKPPVQDDEDHRGSGTQK